MKPLLLFALIQAAFANICYTATKPAVQSFPGGSGPFLVCNGIQFAMQTDGNFVIYNANNQPLWQSGTGGRPKCGAGTSIACNLAFQSDGNLVIYYAGAAIWNSNTANTGYQLRFQDVPGYGFIVNQAGTAIWQT